MKHFLITIGNLLLLDVFFLLFVSGFHIGMLIQAIIAILLIIYAFYFVLIKRRTHIIIAIFSVIPFIFMIALAIYGNIDSVAYNEDAVIVLGTGMSEEKIGSKLSKRLDKAAKYYEKNPDAIIVVSGGKSGHKDITEAQVMENYLLDKKIPIANIIKEEKSTSTYESLSSSKKILYEHFPYGFTSVLVTNDYQIYRATETARDAGFSAGHTAVKTALYSAPADYLGEMFAVIKMWLISEK
ncbi:MAG: YdcF family protein [Oscillospiraceae bacterium]|nr:YdcF family protein [Oscillospiraceae bacterium]MDD4413055.1 YdcF family protein [Oscillospiraceae bacterium]